MFIFYTISGYPTHTLPYIDYIYYYYYYARVYSIYQNISKVRPVQHINIYNILYNVYLIYICIRYTVHSVTRPCFLIASLPLKITSINVSINITVQYITQHHYLYAVYKCEKCTDSFTLLITVVNVADIYLQDTIFKAAQDLRIRLFGGQNLIPFLSLPHQIFCTRMLEEKNEQNNGYLVEWMLWKNGYHLVHTTPNHKGCSSKNFVQIIHAAKWLVRNSSIRPPTMTVTTFAFSSVFIFLLLRSVLTIEVCSSPPFQYDFCAKIRGRYTKQMCVTVGKTHTEIHEWSER